MKLLRSTLILAESVALLAASAAAQSVVHYLPDGGSVVRVGDFDHDGIDDFADRSSDGVRVRSGSTAAVLLVIDTSALAGTALAACGDLDHDGVPDLVVGDYAGTLPSGAWVGRTIAFSGATGAELWSAWGSANSDAFGFSVGAAGDANADGTPDVLANAFQYNPPFNGPGYARLLSGVDGSVLRQWTSAVPDQAAFGHGLGWLGDFDGDGHDDQLVSDLAVGGGVVFLYSGADGSVLKVFDPPVDGSFGMSLDGGRDLDGDGVRDLAATAPGWNEWRGRVAVLSGADASILVDVQGTLPYETYLGQDVDFVDDIDGDGVPEVVTGGKYWESLPDAEGFVLLISGADSSILTALAVPALGLGILGSTVAGLDDLDGDGRAEFAVSAGGLFVFSYASDPPVSFCPSKVNSQGCTPAVTWSGTASLTGPADFQLACTGMLNQMRGALMWSSAASAPPYQGGTLCLAAPWKPASPFFTGGSPSGIDCSGFANLPLSQTFLAGTGVAPGASLHVQFFYRDPPHLDGTGLGLSEGVRFSVLP